MQSGEIQLMEYACTQPRQATLTIRGLHLGQGREDLDRSYRCNALQGPNVATANRNAFSNLHNIHFNKTSSFLLPE
jgi:hypothetical protein